MNPTIQTVSTIGSERATQGSGNMMVTWSNRTHVVWQDSPGVKAYKNMVRTLDRTTGEWSPAYELNNAKDNHARPVIAVDSRGYLHIVLGGHHSPVTHITSVRPNDASEWGAPEDVGFGTYPMLVIAADDTLHMTMRNDKGWDGANYFVKPPAGKWSSRHLVKRSYGSGYAAYHNMLALGPDGALHLVCHFYEGDGIMDNRGRHQAIAAMKSTDQGKTWTRYDGTPVAVPARVEDMDVIASDMNTNRPASQPMPVPILSMPALAVSSGGGPHVMYVSHLANRGEVMVASPDAKGKWTARHVDAIEKAYANWRPVALEPGAFTIADGDVFFALFSLLPLDYPDGWIGNQPTREMTMAEIKGAPVVWLVSRDGGKTFACERAVPEDPESNIAILQIEKATGHNRVPLSNGYPDLFYFEGNADYPKEGEVIQNKVLLSQRRRGRTHLDKGEWITSSTNLISTAGSERATSSFGNRIVTLGDKVHVVWQDACEPNPDSGVTDAHYGKPYADYPAQVRSLDLRTGAWSPTVTLGLGQDNHGRPTIAADSNGYLHVILGGHHTPMRHFKSTAPNDSTSWETLETFGKNTYPVFTIAPDDTFYLIARHDEGWQGTDFYIRRPGGPWEPQGLLVQREPEHVGYCAFASAMAVGPDGVLHFVSDFYESRGIHDQRGLKQAVATMRSRDGGRSWQRADGTPIRIPARPEDMDLLELFRTKRKHEPMPSVLSQGCIGVDSRGVPHVFYVSHIRVPGEMILASPDAAGVWQKRVIDPAVTGFPNHRPKGECRGRFVVTPEDQMHLILSLYPLNDEGWKDGRPAETQKFFDEPTPVVKLVSSDLGSTWSARKLEPPREGGLLKEPNMERCSTLYPIKNREPHWIFFDGLSRYPGPKEVINTKVYFVEGGRSDPESQVQVRP